MTEEPLWPEQCATACPVKKIRHEYLGWGDRQETLLRVGRMLRGGMPEAMTSDLTYDDWEFLGVASEERENANVRVLLAGLGVTVD